MPPPVVRIWGSAPRLPTRITIFVIEGLLHFVAGTAPSTARGEARRSGGAHRSRRRRGTPDQGRRGQPEGQHGPQGRGLRAEAAEPGGLKKEMGTVWRQSAERPDDEERPSQRGAEKLPKPRWPEIGRAHV